MILKEQNGNTHPTLILLHLAPILPTLTLLIVALIQTLVQTRIQVPTRGIRDRRSVLEQAEKVEAEVVQEDERPL